MSDSHLDNDVELTLKKGDVCVQRGTIHGWENKSDKPARIYFILTGKRISLFGLNSANNAGYKYECSLDAESND